MNHNNKYNRTFYIQTFMQIQSKVTTEKKILYFPESFMCSQTSV